ncbi:MAG: shikimate dehydrogenase (NADP(+)) [Isosphaeraceae bacterium]|jgi:3-dehydroquinate dehydratase/shikimate dehydrogenase|nr:MAG: shikimate dehydrogenase (NADP(+)) [Isosphaeraceae bacterium]
MICVILGRGRHKSLISEWKQASEAGVQLVELRIDCLRREPDLKRLLAERYTPVVLTIRRGADGGLYRGDEAHRERLLREAIVLGVDYVDLEMDTAARIPRPKFGHTKRIISYHNFKGTPDDLDDIAQKMRELDADIIKIATLAKSVGDASRMLDFVAHSNKTIPTIGIAMGDFGVFTRILGRKFGSPFTYAGFNPDRIFAPGLLRFSELQRDYFYDQIDAATELYAVIGDPIAHSLSPAVHNTAFRALGLNKVLVPIRIPAGTLADSLSVLEWLDLKGLSITIPHKEAILPLLQSMDPEVERLGACNTAVRTERGWVGHNTDAKAAMDCLEEVLGGSIGTSVSPLMDKQVLILGSGGVARTIAAGCLRRGAGVTICSRNEEKASKLAEELGCRSVPWSMRAGTLCDVMINGTPVGMHPDVDSSPVPAAAFRPGMLVFDTVYHPENTLFLKLARDHECATLTGVDMFVRQAALQFRYYTGLNAPEDLMYQTVKNRLNPAAV